MTTIVVFLPIVYLHGASSEMFRDQAWTVAFSLLSSLVVAMLVIPMLVSTLFSDKKKKKEISGALKFNWYSGFLAKILEKRNLVIILSVVILAGAALLIPRLDMVDMGPVVRYLGPLVPKEELIWQDPIPAVDHRAGARRQDVAALKAKILASGLSISELVTTAWASASTFRGGGRARRRNGARVRLAPQKDWEVNQPAALAKVIDKLTAIQKEFNTSQTGGKKVSLADLIVLAGSAARRKGGEGRRCRGCEEIPFTPGRMDASQEQTDAQSFAPLEPRADGFRNYTQQKEGAVHGTGGSVG